MSHIPTVQAIYGAFGRGDVPAILALLSADVDWEYGGGSTDVPWLQPGRGLAAAGAFFQALAAIEITRLEPRAVMESGATVVALFQLEATVKATGRTVVEEDEVHIWQFDAAGKVARFRHRVDTHMHFLAFHGT
jgi:uncharacterized protein